MESLKNLKPTGLGLRIERIKPPFVVENPAKQVIKLSSLNNELGRTNTQKNSTFEIEELKTARRLKYNKCFESDPKSRNLLRHNVLVIDENPKVTPMLLIQKEILPTSSNDHCKNSSMAAIITSLYYFCSTKQSVPLIPFRIVLFFFLFCRRAWWSFAVWQRSFGDWDTLT